MLSSSPGSGQLSFILMLFARGATLGLRTNLLLPKPLLEGFW